VTPDDSKYFGELQKLMKTEGVEKLVCFVGGVTPERVREFYWGSDINVNLAPTGGIDKVIIEGIAAGVMPLASNEAFKEAFGPYSKDLLFTLRDPMDLAQKIKAVQARQDRQMVLTLLQHKVEEDFSHKNLIKKILSFLS
jgi:glycosyltransferase involved in cell wall biosynthesis